jgi:hypothetical protein
MQILHGTKDEAGAGTGHQLHWDQQLGGQREEALGEGGRQQDHWWIFHQTLHQQRRSGADQPCELYFIFCIYISLFYFSFNFAPIKVC